MSRDWTEDEIAAFVDGDLDNADARRIAAIIETDDEARTLAERIGNANAWLRDAFDTPMQEPPPETLVRTIRGATVHPIRRSPVRRPAWVPLAMAASIALIVGVGAGATLFGPGSPVGPGVLDGSQQVAAVDVGPAPETLNTVLETASSGTESAGVRPVATFVGGGQACREFEALDTDSAPIAAGLACRDTTGSWTVLVVAAIAGEEAPTGDGYLPAAGAAWDSFGVVLDAIGATAALSPGEEAARIAARWE